MEIQERMKSKNQTIEQLRAQLDVNSLPKHVAVIMDGNGRWALRKGLPRVAGHKRGVDTVRRVTEQCRQYGIQVLTLYAFSDENWGRPKEEVGFLMDLLGTFLKAEIAAMKANGITIPHHRQDRAASGINTGVDPKGIVRDRKEHRAWY